MISSGVRRRPANVFPRLKRHCKPKAKIPASPISGTVMVISWRKLHAKECVKDPANTARIAVRRRTRGYEGGFFCTSQQGDTALGRRPGCSFFRIVLAVKSEREPGDLAPGSVAIQSSLTGGFVQDPHYFA
jgi:hypothetical protein